MSIRLLLTLSLCLHLLYAFAQPISTLLVKAGEDVYKLMPRNEKYGYAEFLEGQLYYPQSKRSEILKLNYNILVGAMQFIDFKGDTMFISEESNIFRYIRIQNDLYYHDFTLGYFEMLTREDPIKLLAQLKWKHIRKETVVNNGYGDSSSASSESFSSRRSDITFVQNENILYGKDLSYYLLGKKDKIYKATKAGFIKAFPDNKKKIKLYLNEQEIDFRNEQDLKELLVFCNGFTNS